MIAYSAIPTAKKQIEKFKLFPFWRWMLSIAPSPKKILSELPRRYAIDNGAYSFFLKDKPYNATKFLKLLDLYGEDADWVVIPDQVGDCDETLRLFDYWVDKIPFKKLIVLQDGITFEHIADRLDLVDGFFVGGTTEFKLDAIAPWSKYAKTHNKIIHVGRVNTIKRAKLCNYEGVDSFDGSGFARFDREFWNMSYFMQKISKQPKISF